MAVIGSKTKIKTKAKTRSVVQSNKSTPVGGSSRSGKVKSYEGLPPVGGSMRKKIVGGYHSKIGGSYTIPAPKGPKVKKTRKKK